MTAEGALAAGASPTEERPTRFRDGLRDAVVVFIGVRMAVFVLSALAATQLMPFPADQPATGSGFPPPSLEPGWHVVFTGTQRQDAFWYLRLATGGYETGDASAAFFPLYPALIRVLTWIPGVGPLAAALVISNAAFLGALIVFHALTRREFGDDVARARRAVRYLAIFPTAFFFLAPYTESLFLLLCLLAFWWARADRWGPTAVAGILAALTRSPGIVLLVALAVEALDRSREDRRSPVPRLAAAAAVALAPLGWFAWWQVRYGDFWAPLSAQRLWSRRSAPPWETVADAVWHAWRYRAYWLLDLIVVALAITGIVLVIRRVRPAYLVYAGGSILLPLLVPYPDRPLLSMPRFVAVVFPFAWGYASAVSRRWLPDALVTGTFMAGYALLAALFIAWLYVF